jgi:hypothetical protein
MYEQIQDIEVYIQGLTITTKLRTCRTFTKENQT